jgi:hypothetical protein
MVVGTHMSSRYTTAATAGLQRPHSTALSCCAVTVVTAVTVTPLLHMPTPESALLTSVWGPPPSNSTGCGTWICWLPGFSAAHG